MEWISIKESLPPIDREVVLYSTRRQKASIVCFRTIEHAMIYFEDYMYDYWIYAPKKEENEDTN